MPQGSKREVPDSSPEASQGQAKRSRLSNSDMPYEAPAMDNRGSVPPSVGDMGSPIMRHQHPQQPCQPVPIQQQAAAPPQQMPPPPIQADPSLLAEEHQPQAKIIHWILSRPAYAFYDILGLANGTPMYDLVERAWLNMTFLVHPFRCTHPNAFRAFCRVNGAYHWIRKHPGCVQPCVPLSPRPPVAQDASNAPEAPFNASFPGGVAVMELQQPWDHWGTQHTPQ